MGFAGFTGRELDVLALLVNGVPPPAIARRLGFARQRVYELLKGIYSKVGTRDVAALTEWAREHALDEPLPAETSETRPYPGTPAPRQKRIKLRRMRGTGTKRRETRWPRSVPGIKWLTTEWESSTYNIGMKLPPLIPTLSQAEWDLKSLLEKLFAAFEYGAGEARATAEDKGYDGSFYSHQVRYEAKFDLKQNGIESDDSDCELANTANTGIHLSLAGYSVRVLRSQNGEIPEPDSDRRKRFLEQKSEQIPLDFGDSSPLSAETESESESEREPVHIALLWESDSQRFFTGFWLTCPNGVGQYHFKQWLPLPQFGIGNPTLGGPDTPPPPPPVEDLNITSKETKNLPKTGTEDQNRG